MNCASCGRANPAGARFCGGCGTALAPRCPSCGAESQPDARFCTACGGELDARPAAKAIARKVVTVVFADLIGSVSLHERLDPEAARRFMGRYHRAMTAAVDVHGGKVIQLLGDGVLAAFGVPRVAEDDAIRAVRAAVGMQRAFRELMREQRGALEEVGLRVAVNTGEVVVSDDETAVMGDPTNVAARLQHEARDGDVLVGEATQRLVADLVTLAPFGTFALKGRSESVAAHRVVSLDRPAGAHTTAFVGRDDELRRLVAVYERAVAAPTASLAVLLGSPGLGKSRLLGEVAERVRDRATILTARCDAAGGPTFAPIGNALRSLLRIEAGAGGDVLRAAIDAVVPGDESERTRIALGVGALFSGAPSSPEEIFFAVRRLLAALAAVRPVVLVIDDLHWAEPLLLDLIEHLVQWSAGVPLFLLVAARPELRDARSSLTAPGTVVADAVTLGGLDARASMLLAAGVVGASELPAALVGRVLATSEGNPLFLAELVRMLVQDGTLVREGDRWVTTVEVSKLEMPPTIQVLLAARIERLRPEERSVLERAAVVGREFSRAAVAHLLGPAPDLDARLEALRRSELVEPDSGWFLGEPALRFHHVLIRDAAYRRLLKETRAELHERLADWIESRAGESIEHDEAIGFHLEQAHENRLEVDPLDARGRALGERAAARLGAAGRRALARDDVARAAGLLGRAVARLQTDDPARADLALDWCEALLAAGEVSSAAHAVAELGRFVAASERLRAWHACFAGQLAALTDPQSLRETAEAVAAAAEALAVAGDAAGEAKAHSVHAGALARLGKVGACEGALDRALAAARRARDRRRANAVLAGAPLAALWGPSPVTRASGRCLDVVRVLRITQGAPAVEAVALRCQAVLETLRGRGDAARRMIASARRMVEELGIAQQVLEADVFAGRIELLERDAAAAEPHLRRAYDGLREHGLGIDAARAAALLGRALLAQDRVAEAEALSHESEALAGDDLAAAIAWRGVRAEALARRGEAAAGVDLARAAVAIAADTDALLDHADARTSLAVALRAAGRAAEGDAEERRAVDLWQSKGATLLVERPREEPDARAGAPVQGQFSLPLRASRLNRANAASAHHARLAAAIAARDEMALRNLLADDFEAVNHLHGTTYDGEGPLAAWRGVLRSAGAFAVETVATLGESLAIARTRWSSDGYADRTMDVGPVAHETLVLTEVNERGRARRSEVFGPDRLADAVARLYDRHAEQLAAGPERDRATATSRTVAAVLGLAGGGCGFRDALAPDLRYVDHRRIGFGEVRSDDVARGNIAFDGLLEIVERPVEEIFALQRDALLARRTIRGRDRQGAGLVEYRLIELFGFGADGLLARLEHFEPWDVELALARFDRGAAGSAERPPVLRRVRPNRATSNPERLEAAIAARDVESLRELHSPQLRCVIHQTGEVVGRDEVLEWWRLYFEDRDAAIRLEPIATLGESLALIRGLYAGTESHDAAFATGAFELAEYSVVRADAAGRPEEAETFPPARLGDAVGNLYARWAEGEAGTPYAERAAAVARAVAAAVVAAGDPRALAPVLAPDVAFTDHRVLGFGSSRGAERYLRGMRSLLDVTDARGALDRDVLVATGDALLIRRCVTGVDRDGGAFEMEHLLLWTFDREGRIDRIEMFEPERAAEALARIDAVAPEAEPPFANAASRVTARLAERWSARDWDGVLALYVPEPLLDDRRGVVSAPPLSGASFFSNLRLMFDLPKSGWSNQLIATRGDSLALSRTRFTGSSAGAPVEFEHLSVVEADALGRYAAVTIFDVEDRGAARAELDARFAALSRGASQPSHFVATAGSPVADPLRIPSNAASRAEERWGEVVAARDRDALHRLFAPDLVWEDRRPMVGDSGTRDALLANVQLIEGSHFRAVDHELLAISGDRLALSRSIFRGPDRDAPIEIEVLQIVELDAARRIAAVIHFDPGDRRAAAIEMLERYMRGEGARSMPPAQIAFLRAMQAHDLAAMRAALDPDFALVDHRRTGLGRVGNADDYVASVAALVEQSDDFATDVLYHVAVAEHGSLSVGRLFGTLRDGGPFESAFVRLNRYEDGRNVGVELFELADVDRAKVRFEELARAWAERRRDREAPAPNAAARIWDAIGPRVQARDWTAVRAHAAPDFAFQDRTRRSLVSGDVELYVRNLEFVRSWPGRRVDRRLVATAGERLAIDRIAFVGDPDGSAFEGVFLRLTELDVHGRLRAVVHFDDDAEDAARAEMRVRLARSSARDIPANAAVRAGERLRDLALASDWEGLRDHCAPDLRFEDRRPLLRNEGDREMLVANTRHIGRAVWERSTRTLLATSGERLALHRNRFAGGSEDTRFEVESLEVTEVDAEGRLLATVIFDAEDRRAASLEMSERMLRGEAESVPRAALRVKRAFLERDLETIRATVHEDFALDDRRRTGVGRMESVDEFLGSLAALFAQSSDVIIEPLQVIAVGERGYLDVAHMFGTMDASGGSFESVYARLLVFEGDRLLTLELHELDALEVAKARFDAAHAEARRGDPLAIPPNAASRAMQRFGEAADARDWQVFETLLAPAFTFDDRRPGIRLTGDRETMLRSIRLVASSGTRWSGELVATAGDRLALAQNRFWTADGDTLLTEIATLQIAEVDAEGRLVAHVVFDGGDRRAAAVEMFERFFTRTAEGARTPAAQIAMTRAIQAHDAAALRAFLPDDFTFVDHRRTGLGSGGAEHYAAWLAAVIEQSDDVAIETLYFVAIAEHGTLSMGRAFGTLRDGGPFESPVLRLNRHDGERWVGVEIFEPEDLQRAKARFEELAGSRR